MITIDRKIVTLDALQCYHKNLKKYIDMRISLEVHGRTNCPNCGAVIHDGDKCEYCGTDFSKWLSES